MFNPLAQCCINVAVMIHQDEAIEQNARNSVKILDSYIFLDIGLRARSYRRTKNDTVIHYVTYIVRHVYMRAAIVNLQCLDPVLNFADEGMPI